MKPYYDEEGVTLYLGDCREILLELATVDAVVTDPPYGETSIGWDRRVNEWTASLPTRVLWCFGSLRFWLESGRDSLGADWRYAQEIVWEKHNGTCFHNDRFRRVHELAVMWYRGEWASIYKSTPVTNDAIRRTIKRRKTRPPHHGHIESAPYESVDGGPRLMRSVIHVRSCHGHALHPTEKPVGILTPLIEYSVPPVGLVLDPFAGSGSTLVAAKQLGRRAIGIEIEERYCEIAAKRLSQGVLPLAASSAAD